MTTGAGAAWRLEVHARLDSTQDVALAAGRAGAAEGLAVLALDQSAGRGSHGRSWDAPAGNLNLSVLLRPLAEQPGQWAVLAAVALHDAFAPLLRPGVLTLKWPNDLLAHGAKLGGILIDADPAAGWMVLGIGVNLQAAPVLPGRSTGCLAALVLAAPTQEQAANMVLAALAHWRGVLETQGFAPVRAAWLAAGPAPGSVLRVRQGSLYTEGRFAGLDGAGALCLDTASGRVVVHAGEIVAEEA